MYKHISSQLFVGGNIMYREREEGQLDDGPMKTQDPKTGRIFSKRPVWMKRASVAVRNPDANNQTFLAEVQL